MLQEFSLTGKVALVTGAGSPLGRAIALGLAEAGASIVAVARDGGKAQGTAAEVARAGGKAIAVQADVTNEAQAQSAVSRAVAGFGRLDVLVNGEEVAIGKPTLETSVEEFRKVFDVNVTSAFICCKAAAPTMIKQGQGRIINLSSGLAVRGIVGGATFGASKAAINELTQSLAVEWGPSQISVNAIAPGWFADGPIDRMEDLKQPLVRMIPQRRRGQPEDIAGIVVYLASEAGYYTTGQTILVDGGAHVHA